MYRSGAPRANSARNGDAGASTACHAAGLGPIAPARVALALALLVGGPSIAIAAAVAARPAHADALVLYDPARGPGEYFIVESRWREGSYDAGVPGAGAGIAADGVAVWHLRANGGTPIDDAQALLSKNGAGLTARWLDGEPAFTVALATDPGAEVKVRIVPAGAER